jgi:hypothetical protein
MSEVLQALQRLTSAADVFIATQTGAHPACGIRQPVTRAEAQELNDAVEAAWKVLDNLKEKHNGTTKQ